MLTVSRRLANANTTVTPDLDLIKKQEKYIENKIKLLHDSLYRTDRRPALLT